MDYDSAKCDANFVEDGVLLVQPNDRDLWINLVIKNDNLSLFDYHTGRLLKAYPITQDFDHGNIMQPDLEMFLQWKNNKKSNIYLKTRDEGQKLRIGINLATAYASKVQGIPPANVEEIQNELLSIYRADSDYSDNASTIPDSPKPPSPVSPGAGMSADDAKATIRPGTVGSMKDLLGSDFLLNVNSGYKARIGTRPPIPRLMEVPPDPPERYEPEPELESESAVEPENVPDYGTYNSDDNEAKPVSVSLEYATTIEIRKQWLMDGSCPTRQQAEERVKDKANGTFVVRNREGIDATIYPYAVTMAYDSNPVHIQIQRTRDGGLVFAPYKAGEKSFNDLDDLIQHYQDNKFYFATHGKQGHVSLRRND
jgi:hypothetical protein